MLLGDRIKSLTDKMGIKQCGGCTGRQVTLNIISRRGLIGGSVAALFLAKNTLLSAVWQLAGQTVAVENAVALGFVRQVNTAAYALTAASENLSSARHPGRDEIFALIASHREHFAPGTSGYEWMRRFRPAAGDDALATWKNAYAIVRGRLDATIYGADGYRFAIYNETTVFVTDEYGLIYQAPMPEGGMPDISKLASASDFPLAAASDLVGKALPQTRWEQVIDFFRPLVFATSVFAACSGCDTRCSNSCGCVYCLTHCTCSPATNCSLNPVPGTCEFNASCSGAACIWYYSDCGDTDCNCCAKFFGVCCMRVAPCTATCSACGF